MKIPIYEGTGYPTVSPTQLRTYGAGGFRLAEQEESRGCPRQYKAKYVDGTAPERKGFALLYGGLIHSALYLMEEEAIGPEEALERVWLPELGPEVYREALDDLTGYLERGNSPTDRYGTIGVEVELTALLYEDEDFGPIYMRGIVDWLGVDLNEPTVIHVVDYKTNRHPPSTEDVRGDVQLKAYDWLLRQNWSKYMKSQRPQVVLHLDAIKWREIEVRFSEQDIEDWHSWTVAVVRQILRDEEALPIINSGCSWCPVSGDCPAYSAMPEIAEVLIEDMPAPEDDDVARLEWRDQANEMRLLLEKAVKKVDGEFKDRAMVAGDLQVGGTTYAVETKWEYKVDLRELHRAVGNDVFYGELVSTSKTKIEKVSKQWPASDAAAAMAAVKRVPTGSSVVRKDGTGE